MCQLLRQYQVQYRPLRSRRTARPKIKLSYDYIQCGYVQGLLRKYWSPLQISVTLASSYPKGHEHSVSTETIYNCIYATRMGELRYELIACLRHAHNMRVPGSKGQDRRGQIPDMLIIYVRPPKIEDRQFPGHLKGDRIKGEANARAVGTLVERTSRLVMLVKLIEFKSASADKVLQTFTDKLLEIAQPVHLSMTYDQVREMSMHQKLTQNTGIAVYFCNLHSPWQRGSNEKMNYLVR